MATEIERKFLVSSEAWRGLAEGIPLRQGYLVASPARSVRVRRYGDRAFLTVKGPTQGISRPEFEYAIPVSDATRMLDTLCEGPLIEKTRYKILHEDRVWTVDEFHGDNDGLVLAEVELPSEDAVVVQPDWIGEEVSEDPRYYNARLIHAPYKTWAP